MKTETFIDSLAAIQSAVRDGAKWEFLNPNNNEWTVPMCLHIDALNSLVKAGVLVRLAPKPAETVEEK